MRLSLPALDDDGDLYVRVVDRCLVAVVCGHLSAERLQALLDVCDNNPDVRGLFIDMAEVTSYAADARRIAAEWGAVQRARFSTVELLCTSELIAMGMSVAGLGLSRFHIWKDRRAFDSRLREARESFVSMPLADIGA